jgi:hypothetical protein
MVLLFTFECALRTYMSLREAAIAEMCGKRCLAKKFLKKGG